MGRPRKGWTIRHRKHRDSTVRFTYDGKQQEINLRTRDPRLAEERAPEEYARFIEQSKQARIVGETRLIDPSQRPFDETGAAWLASVEKSLREVTFVTYRGYIRTLGKHFATLGQLNTTEEIRKYIDARLLMVQRRTLKHETSTIGAILRFAESKGWIVAAVPVPRMPARAKGTKCGKHRTKAASHTDEEILAVIAALPEWSRRSRTTGKRHPIRARFVFAYETPLRPYTIDSLEVPTHWSKGRTSVWIPDEHDKIANGREVPLTAAAIAALESVAPSSGLIFGRHDYREHLRKAARAAGMAAHKLESFCSQHFRSAGGTHLLDVSKNDLLGVAYVLGHTQITTTARYMRPDERAGSSVIQQASQARSA